MKLYGIGMASLIYIEYFYQYLLQEEYVFNTGLGEANIYIYIYIYI